MGGFRKCKVHCCNFKSLKVTNLQSSAFPGFEPGTPAWTSFPMLSGSHRSPGFKSRRSRTLKIGNFEALEVTAMYFTFSETSSLYLFGQEWSRGYLFIQSMICYCEWHSVYIIKSQTGVSQSRWVYFLILVNFSRVKAHPSTFICVNIKNGFPTLKVG